jgi:hypothetical protein
MTIAIFVDRLHNGFILLDRGYTRYRHQGILRPNGDRLAPPGAGTIRPGIAPDPGSGEADPESGEAENLPKSARFPATVPGNEFSLLLMTGFIALLLALVERPAKRRSFFFGFAALRVGFTPPAHGGNKWALPLRTYLGRVPPALFFPAMEVS